MYNPFSSGSRQVDERTRGGSDIRALQTRHDQVVAELQKDAFETQDVLRQKLEQLQQEKEQVACMYQITSALNNLAYYVTLFIVLSMV